MEKLHKKDDPRVKLVVNLYTFDSVSIESAYEPYALHSYRFLAAMVVSPWVGKSSSALACCFELLGKPCNNSQYRTLLLSHGMPPRFIWVSVYFSRLLLVELYNIVLNSVNATY